MEQKARAYAEEAIRAVGRGDAATARTAIAQAFDLDHHAGPLVDAIYLACAEIERDEGVSTATWNVLGDAVGSAELYAVVEEVRS